MGEVRQYRHIAYDVEAAFYDGTKDSAEQIAAWSIDDQLVVSNRKLAMIDDAGNQMVLPAPCYVVRRGEQVWVLAPEDFEANYERAGGGG